MRTPARLLSLALLAAVPASSQTATRLMDFSALSTSDVETSSPRDFLALDDRVVFTAEEPGTGREVWASDGTSAGTELLRDVCPGRCSAGAELLGTANGFAFWAASSDGERSAPNLWRTDGTRAGTAAVGPAGSPLALEASAGGWSHAFLGNVLYVSACGEGPTCGLWRTDGTAAGTRFVNGLEPGGMAAAGGRLFLLAEHKLWVSDGTAAGTHSLAAFPAVFPEPRELFAAGNKVFFIAQDGGDELWASDGTARGTRPVLRLPSNGGFPTFGTDDPAVLFKAAGNRLYFVADDVRQSEEIWVSDGTPQGTRRVTDFAVSRPFDPAMSPRHLEEVNGRLVFVASDGRNGNKIWTTDGRPESTAPVKDICPGGCGFASFGYLARAGGRVFFSADDGSHGFELWSTDGTAAGTRMVRDICTSPNCGGDPHSLRALLGGVVFVARAPDLVGTEVWFSDGTAQGTRPLSDFGPGEGAFAFEVVAAGGKVFFAAFSRYGEELWAYDGRETRLVADIARRERGSEAVLVGPAGGRMLFRTCENNRVRLRASGGTPETTVALPLDGLFCSDALPAAPVGDRLFFVKASSIASNSPRSLWRSDGTAAGTIQLLELATPGDYLTPPVDVQGQAWFVVYGASGGGEVWRSDGTPQGTVKAFDVPAGLWELKSIGNRLYFITVSDTEALWSSDGTLAGSRKVFEGNLLYHFAGAGSQAFFLAIGEDAPQLWRTDGTAAGTGLVASFPAFSDGPQKLTLFQGVLYFFADDEEGDWQLWRSDGTAAGTRPLATFAIPGDEVFAEVFEIAAAAGRVFFTAGEEEHRFELWSTDGTEAGTRMLRDIFPGEESSAPAQLTAAGGKVYFTAHDGVHGAELWSSDGTEAGTRLVQDLSPQALSSHPEQLKATATHLYFTADDGATGREPWALPLAGAGCQPSSTRLCLSGGRFQVEALWRDFQGNSGAGQAVPLSADTGTFWFFRPENIETVVKVLDGRGVNEHQWVFYGSLSNVEFTLTVTDTQTGLARRYFNPLRRFASVGDTRAFGRLGAFSRDGGQVAAPAPLALVSSRTDPAALSPIAAACVPAPTRLCLNGNRFAVEVAWKDFQGHTGTGKAVGLTPDTGYFWFFDAANVELVLKVLDGTHANGRHWVFYGALSNVEYTITVTDTLTGAVKTYQNPAGRFASVGDTGAF